MSTKWTFVRVVYFQPTRLAGFLPVERMRALFKTTASVAVLWMTAAHSGLIMPKAPMSMAPELTRIVARKF